MRPFYFCEFCKQFTSDTTNISEYTVHHHVLYNCSIKRHQVMCDVRTGHLLIYSTVKCKTLKIQGKTLIRELRVALK